MPSKKGEEMPFIVQLLMFTNEPFENVDVVIDGLLTVLTSPTAFMVQFVIAKYDASRTTHPVQVIGAGMYPTQSAIFT